MSIISLQSKIVTIRCYFFSEATKYFDSSISDPAKSSLALVGYRINSSFQLERLSRGLTWDGQVGPSPAPGSMVFLTPSGSLTPVSNSTIAGNWAAVVGAGPGYSNGTGADYHVIGDQVYRLEVSFLQSNGTISTSVTSLQWSSGYFRNNSRARNARYEQPCHSGTQWANNKPDRYPNGKCAARRGGRHGTIANLESE